MNFIAKILTLLKKYLSYQDPILNNLDFVALVDSPQGPFVQKVIFNEAFQIVEQKYVQALSLEAMTLCERIPHYLNLRVKNFSHIWDTIQQTERFKYLTQVVLAAQTLATSSFTIEQTFSIIRSIQK